MKAEFIFLILTTLALGSSEVFGAPPVCSARAVEAAARARGHFEQRRFLLAATDFSVASALACDEPSAAEDKLGYADSLFALGEIRAARSEWTKIATSKNSPNSSRLAAQLQLALQLEEEVPGMLPAAKDVLTLWRAKGEGESYAAAVKSSGFSAEEKISLGRLRPDYFPLKSPLLAGLASGLLPGAGQAYVGMYQTAAVSFVLNGLFLFSALELKKKKLPFSAAISGVAFSTVYLGNIISAVQGAKAVNRAHEGQMNEGFAGTLREMAGRR